MKAKIIIYESAGGTPAFEFEGDDLISCQFEQHSSFAGTELNNDVMTATVRSANPSGSDQIVSSSGDSIQCQIKSGSAYYAGDIYTLANKSVIDIPRGTPADLTLHDVDTGSDHVINYIFDSARMISSGYYTLNFMSPMTYLGERSSKGINTYIGRPSQLNTVGSLVGVFNQRAGLGNLLSALTPISNVEVNGIIETSESIRDAICKIQMVAGACIVNGKTLMAADTSGSVLLNIPEDNCGNQSITYPERTTKIELNSWYYDEFEVDSEEIYNTNAFPHLSGSVFDFDIDAPYTHWELEDYIYSDPMVITGLGTQHITVEGEGKITIYKHRYLPVAHTFGDSSANATKIVKVDNNTLINADNYASIGAKLLNFYAHAQKHEVTVYDKLLLTNHFYTFTDATGARKTGLLTDMIVTLSHTVASRCTFITDYDSVLS